VINSLLGYVGIKGPGWLADPAWAKPAFILIGIWAGGTSIILYLAALKDVPASLHEAAAIDGANGLQQMWYVTLPLLTPIIGFMAITGVIATFQQFAYSLVMTEGGPNNATHFISFYLFRNAFTYFRMGYASAMAWILLLIVFVISGLLFKLTEWLSKR
jgi:multiple sugar transport system permease protein